MHTIEKNMPLATKKVANIVAFNPHKMPNKNSATGKTEPQVPGANGDSPNPKHDVKALFILVFINVLPVGV